MPARLSFEERLENCHNEFLKKLYQIILTKRSTLCVAADVDGDTVLELAEAVGPHICMLKLHSYLHNSSLEILEKLDKIKRKHNFLLFEDCKLKEAGYPAERYYKGIVKYADLITVDPQVGKGVFEIIKPYNDEPRGCLGLCELSFQDADNSRCVSFLKKCEQNSPACVGIIAQDLNVSDPANMIKATPGVSLSHTSDGKSQQWRSPDQVVANGTDVLIVGRGITSCPANEWESISKRYKTEAYEAYLRSLK